MRSAIFFPPAPLGGVLNGDTIPRLRCEIVAGGANNQLLSDADGDLLEERGMTYAPDYVVNAGGIINVGSEIGGVYRKDRGAGTDQAHLPDDPRRDRDRSLGGHHHQRSGRAYSGASHCRRSWPQDDALNRTPRSFELTLPRWEYVTWNFGNLERPG